MRAAKRQEPEDTHNPAQAKNCEVACGLEALSTVLSCEGLSSEATRTRKKIRPINVQPLGL